MSIAKSIGIGVESGYFIKRSLERKYDEFIQENEKTGEEIFSYKFYFKKHDIHDFERIEEHIRLICITNETKEGFVRHEMAYFAKYIQKEIVNGWADMAIDVDDFGDVYGMEIQKAKVFENHLFTNINWEKKQ